jgi:hypothetical protein
MLNNDSEDILFGMFEGNYSDIFKNQIKNAARTAKGRRYSPKIKQFALTLHYYSPKAYAYCR